MIKLPAGHSENLDGDHSFLEWVKDPSLQEPIPMERSEAGRRLEAAVKLCALRYSEYLASVISTNGPDHADQRAVLNTRSCFRRVGMGHILIEPQPSPSGALV